MLTTQPPYQSNKHEDATGCLVLIFSTDSDFIRHYCEVFVSLGFKPLTATTPEAATALLRLLVVTMVILDQESGTPEGCQVLRRMRDLQYHAPVLVIGRKCNPNFREMALSLGATDYLDHPVMRDDVIHALLHSDRRHKRTVPSGKFHPGTNRRAIQ